MKPRTPVDWFAVAGEAAEVTVSSRTAVDGLALAGEEGEVAANPGGLVARPPRPARR